MPEKGASSAARAQTPTSPKRRRSFRRLAEALSRTRISQSFSGMTQGGSASATTTATADDNDDAAAAETAAAAVIAVAGSTTSRLQDSPAPSPSNTQQAGNKAARADTCVATKALAPPTATKEEEEEDTMEAYESEELLPVRWHTEEGDFFVSDIPAPPVTQSQPEYPMSGGRSSAHSPVSRRIPLEYTLPPIPEDGGHLAIPLMESPGRRNGTPSSRARERGAKLPTAKGKEVQGQQEWTTRDRLWGSPRKQPGGSPSSVVAAVTTPANGDGDDDDDDDDDDGIESAQATRSAPGGLTVRSATDTHLLAAARPARRLRNGLASG